MGGLGVQGGVAENAEEQEQELPHCNSIQLPALPASRQH